MTNQNPKNAPVDRIRLGRISAAIWKQTAGDGKTFYNFTIERSYKDDTGNYQSAASFSLGDALVVAKLANLVDTRIRRLLDAEYAATRSEEEYGDAE
ncbi:hypothetical protein KOR34_01110 [Posidoniimonas corsicana]|uniref:Uncharacterized protein n=1 Tax=Posidoniimonas corsicana TaxID=1938618 RepID=A0A5C5VB67_9BACT|nr:hypothetical protein [Posidoniimonas corsicana]TWT35223.1 hypothetical protein KOR34_01110 [Posidoniimonas corsicana]